MLTCFKDLNFVDCFLNYIKNSIEKKVKGVFPNSSVEGKAGKKELAFNIAWEERKGRETEGHEGQRTGRLKGYEN